MNNRLHRMLAVLTFSNLLCLSLQTVLSYGMTLVSFSVPTSQVQVIQDRQAAVYSTWAEQVGGLGRQFADYLRGGSALARRDAFLLAELLPLVISSIMFVVILALLARYRADLTQQTARLLFIAASGFAAASLFAAPFVYQDFWMSVSWGRMVASGVNPYHNDFTAAALQGVPLNQLSKRMTYGPLWAVVSGLVEGANERRAVEKPIASMNFGRLCNFARAQSICQRLAQNHSRRSLF